MLNQPVKLLLGFAAIAVLAASLASHRIGDPVARAPAAAAAVAAPAASDAGASPSRPWYKGWFEGIEFNRGPAPASQGVQAPTPTAVVAARGFGDVRIAADRGGQYHTGVEIDGQTIPMLVDTGATVIALRHEDAMRLGIAPMPSDYTNPVSTANGQIYGARTRLREVRVENIVVSDVTALVLPEGALHKSLLGMSFLRKLAKFEMSGETLILRP